MRWIRLIVLGMAIGLTCLLLWRSNEKLSSVTHTGQPSIASKSSTFFLPPKVLAITPKTGMGDVLLDIEDPITISFDSTVKPYFIRFEVEPFVELVYENNHEKTEFRLLPKTPLRPGQVYTLRLSYRLRGLEDASFAQFFESTFTTLALSPDEWSKDFDERLEQAKKFTLSKHTMGKYIDVNLQSQILSLFENGRLINSYLISSGKPGMETPKGNFALHNKARRPWSKQYSLYMPYWMAIVSDGKFGIHELPEWPGGYKEGANHLGTPVSHGCIRLGVGAAKELYDWAEVGTPIIVY